LLPVALAGALLASGCSFIPTLERPAAPVAEHYSAADEQAGATAAADIPWQQFFTDPRLQQVISSRWTTTATCVWPCSTSKRRAQYQIQRAGQFPSSVWQAAPAPAQRHHGPLCQLVHGGPFHAQLGD
jgi:multidrug efflux system outer membrane protein